MSPPPEEAVSETQAERTPTDHDPVDAGCVATGTEAVSAGGLPAPASSSGSAKERLADSRYRTPDGRLATSSMPTVVVGRPAPAFEPRPIARAHRLTPYRPDSTADGWSTSYATLRAASIRGQYHRYNGAPRQDDFAVMQLTEPNRIVVALADGISAATQSHVGATAAVRYATQWLAGQNDKPADQIDWVSLIESTAWTLVTQTAALLGVPEASADQAEELMATTLVCAVVEPDPLGGLVARVVSVGDSGCWILDGEGAFTAVTGGKHSDQADVTSSAVVGLPRVPNGIEPVMIHVAPDQVLLFATDGFGDPLGDGGGPVGDLFVAVLQRPVPSMVELVYALDFSRETFDDDRTLVAFWPAIT